MNYRVKVVVENCDTGLFSEAERTVTLNVGRYNKQHPTAAGEPRPIDSNQKDRLIQWAANEAVEEGHSR